MGYRVHHSCTEVKIVYPCYNERLLTALFNRPLLHSAWFDTSRLAFVVLPPHQTHHIQTDTSTQPRICTIPPKAFIHIISSLARPHPGQPSREFAERRLAVARAPCKWVPRMLAPLFVRRRGRLRREARRCRSLCCLRRCFAFLFGG